MKKEPQLSTESSAYICDRGKWDFEAICPYTDPTAFLPFKHFPTFLPPLSLSIYYSLMKSSLQLSTNTPLHKEQLTKVKTIWRSLQDHNDSIQFRNPVNYKAMGLYDYPQYIKYPMDLSTIHRKLREQRYRTVEEVLDDIQMIWDNCKAYNPNNSWIYNLSERLEKAFKKMVKSYLPTISNAILVSKDSRDNLEGSKKEEEGEVREQEVSLHLKLQFVDKLRLISPPSLQMMVDLITEICPKAFAESEGRAQILVDLLDVESFRAAGEKLDDILLTDRASSKKIKLY